MNIIESLIKNTSVLDLNLEGNDFGTRGAFIIGEYLRKTKTLQTLHLGNNLIDSLGIKKLAEGLRFNRTLVSLNLCKL